MSGNRRALAILTVFGLGRLRPAPGTWGSLPPVAITLAMLGLLSAAHVSDIRWPMNAVLGMLALAATAACIVWGDQAEAVLGEKDPPSVVADEVAGQCVALMFLPWRGFGDPHAAWWNACLIATAFGAFRVIDIVKPAPAHRIQRWPGGWGIASDDLIAGFYAAIIAHAAGHWFWPIVH